MISSESEALIDWVVSEKTPKRFGGPLAVFALILVAWITGRVALWEDPFPVSNLLVEAGELLVSAETPPQAGIDSFAEMSVPLSPVPLGFADPLADTVSFSGELIAGEGSDSSFDTVPMQVANGHHALWRKATTADMRGVSWRSHRSRFAEKGPRQARLPVLPGDPRAGRLKEPSGQARSPGRWSLGAWAFLREGSNSAPIVQGRVPVYGASQIGANLQYRAAPKSGHDPRLFLRAYRALIEDAESEIAAGVSAKPSSRLPLRLAAELRATDNEFRREIRPAAYAITEIPPISLPLGMKGEIYAGAGYVGGEAETGFIDGQVTLIGKVASFDLRKVEDLNVSFGAGAWGGAQRDANRIDIGPTMRIDLSLGAVPARISINYRERVGGDAAPESGLAATVSTQF